ncbi:hypothetical protein ACN4EE_02895 [Geminocystis sp. CENA526]|uniref:hypothetical protein n=1 Tax=Geminocystis sp. CENA526 TaxID=1355871 RepID=UPI003D6F5336
MKNIINLSLKIVILNIFGLFLFTDSALSQKREFEVQDCYISVDKSELIISAGGGENGCQYQHKFSNGLTEYQLNFDIGYNKPNSKVEIINNGKKNIISIPEFIGVGTAIEINLLNFYSSKNPSLLFRYSFYGNGFNNCNITNMTLFDPNIPSGYIVAKTTNLGVSRLEPENPNYIHSCIDFQDIDNDKVLEIIATDGRFGYQFGACGACSSAPLKVLKFSGNELVDATIKYPNFIQKQAGEAWDRVLSINPKSSIENGSSYGRDTASSGYFLAMATYLALKSLLGEYKEGMALVNKRMEIDELKFTTEGQKFPYDVEEFLIDYRYMNKSDGLMVYLPQNNKLTCQQSIDSVKAELIKRKYFVNYNAPHFGLIKPKLTINKDIVKQWYYEYPQNRTKTVVFQLSGDFDALVDFLRSRKLMESLTARILGSCQDFGLVVYGHWYEGSVPVGYFPDGSVRTFIWVDNYSGNSEYTREINRVTQHKWGYYYSP